MDYAPIVCFGFDRPEHLNNMLSTLADNKISEESIVYICIDGPSENTDISLHRRTIEVAKKNWQFKSKNLILRDKNLDCRTNIISTISELFTKHDKLIILEDDLHLGKFFLQYMNNALNKYSENKNIWHVNGYTYPQLNFSKKSSVSTFISPWGWGTWKDRWDIFTGNDFDKVNLISGLDEKQRKIFNVEGLYDWENIIIKNELGEISAWDAYWYQAVYLNNGLTIFPNKSHVKNKGFDGTGMHCSNNDDWKTPLNSSQTKHFPNHISVSKLFRLNTLLFYRYYNFKRYLRFHKSKIESFENFKRFLRKKISI
jgi:hypothetical protein